MCVSLWIICSFGEYNVFIFFSFSPPPPFLSSPPPSPYLTLSSPPVISSQAGSYRGGLITGGAIRIFGTGFPVSTRFECRFDLDNSLHVTALVLSDIMLECIPPPHKPGFVVVEVTSNRVCSLPPLDFTVHCCCLTSCSASAHCY